MSTSKKTLTCQSCSICCKVTYSWDWTPVLHYMIPAMVYPGMQATVAIDQKNAKVYKHEDQLPIDLRIDGTSMNLTEFHDEDSELNWYVTGLVET